MHSEVDVALSQFLEKWAKIIKIVGFSKSPMKFLEWVWFRKIYYTCMYEDILVLHYEFEKSQDLKKWDKISHFDTACSSRRNINKINGTLDLIDRTQMKVEMNHLKFFLLGGLLFECKSLAKHQEGQARVWCKKKLQDRPNPSIRPNPSQDQIQNQE